MRDDLLTTVPGEFNDASLCCAAGDRLAAGRA
jgi:hypothetical protein